MSRYGIASGMPCFVHQSWNLATIRRKVLALGALPERRDCSSHKQRVWRCQPNPHVGLLGVCLRSARRRITSSVRRKPRTDCVCACSRFCCRRHRRRSRLEVVAYRNDLASDRPRFAVVAANIGLVAVGKSAYIHLSHCEIGSQKGCSQQQFPTC